MTGYSFSWLRKATTSSISCADKDGSSAEVPDRMRVQSFRYRQQGGMMLSAVDARAVDEPQAGVRPR